MRSRVYSALKAKNVLCWAGKCGNNTTDRWFYERVGERGNTTTDRWFYERVGEPGNTTTGGCGREKNKRTMEYVGCDVDTLRAHLERQFVDGMTWENQGEWHIDHVRPCASFNLDNEDERHQCFHYTNLQPLWGPDNLSKNAFYDEDNHPLEWSGDHWEDVAE
jgi:hypothetical protein